MIKCIVVDDEKLAREELIYFLSKSNDFEVLAQGENGIDALNLINKHKPQVVFCDIDMPILDGLKVGKEIINLKFDVFLVYVTAYDEYAISAFENNAIDYLLKPIRKERFEQTLQKIKNKIEKENIHNNIKVDNILNKLNKNDPNNYICLYREGLIYPVKCEEIIYIHKEEKRIRIETIRGIFESNKSLIEFEEVLDKNLFFKCHRSYIININYIETIIPWFNRTFRVKLKKVNEEIPVSRKQTAELKELLKIF